MSEHYCFDCERKIELTEEGRCCDCGMQLNSTDYTSRYYISEPQQGPGLTINLEPGQKLLDGRYTIKSFLGRGSSKVFLADDSVRSEEVTLKVVPLVSDDMANQLKREFESRFRIVDYSHVIRLYDVHVGAYEGVVLLLISAEYACGGTFRQWLLKNKDNICKRQTEGLYYFKQACIGVRALHAVDIVHQNLKPENCLFVDDVLKVSDLGLSRQMHNLQMNGYGHRQGKLGSLPSLAISAYTSPEQIMAPHPGDIDIRADIYSLGAILFELCDPKCKLPFGGSSHQLRQRHLHVPVPTLVHVGPKVAHIVAKCLQKNPSDRYNKVSELIDDLESSNNAEIGQIPEVSSPPQPAEPVEESWQQACQFMDTSNLNEAGRLCDRILSIFPEHREAKSMRDAIDERFQQAKQFYGTIKNSIGNQSLHQLSALLGEAVDIYPDHPDGRLVQAQLVSLAHEYKGIMRDGVEAISEGHWSQAQRNFERALELNPGLPRITELINFVSKVRRQIEAGRAKVDAAIQRQDWNNAKSWARAIDQYVESVKEMATNQCY